MKYFYLTALAASLSTFSVTNGDSGLVKPTSAYPWSSVKLKQRFETFSDLDSILFLHENNVWLLAFNCQ